MSDSKQDSDTFTDRHGNEWNTKPGKRRVDDDKDDATIDAPTHFPHNGETTSMKRFLTAGKSCPLKRSIISYNAPEDFDASLDSKRDFRITCPECGRGVGVDVNKDGVARIATHVRPENDPNPHQKRYIWDSDEEDWTHYDPSNAPEDSDE